MRPTRSLLFVPGHRSTWVDKAVAAGVDGVILDLEDSVPADLKAEARTTVAESIRRTRQAHPGLGIYVRLNALDTGLTGDDLEVVAVEGMDGFVLPKLFGADDVLQIEALTTHFERRNGVAAGSLEFILSFETAESYADCDRMARVSPRVATLFAGTAKDADVARSIGFEFTPEGQETLYLRSKIVLAARAAGKRHPLVGVWQDLRDPEGARRFSEQNRRLGFRGQVLIHPGHAAVANEVFSPSDAEIAYYSGMIAAFEEAEAAGAAAVSYEGDHIDYAHVKTAREILDLADSLGRSVTPVG